MTLLQDNKKYLKKVFKKSLFKMLNILKWIGIILAIIAFIVLPIIKFNLFPAVTSFTDEQIKEYEEIAISIWNNSIDSLDYGEYTISINKGDIKEEELKMIPIKEIDLETIDFTIYYKEFIVSSSPTSTLGIMEKYMFSEHSLKFTFNENNVISIEDNYDDARNAEIALYYVFELFILMIMFIFISCIIMFIIF